MGELSEALDDVRAKIAQYKDRELNEQDTKTALIDPVLRALGWHVGNLEDVRQEYRHTSRSSPVDYALFLRRKPKFFVEAKALEKNLGDPKWAKQIIGYAIEVGIEWVAITDGDEYRIYKAHAAVKIEEKLFRSIRITDENSPAEQILALLSKQAMDEKDEEIERQWKEQREDAKLRKALRELFGTDADADPDKSLVSLLKKRTTDLTSKAIQESLRRLRVSFDFPAEPGKDVSPQPDTPGAPPSELPVPLQPPRNKRHRRGRKGLWERMKEARLDANLSQAAAGKLFGVSQSTYCCWEKGPKHDRDSRVQGKRISKELAFLVKRWVEQGQEPTPDELVALRSRRGRVGEGTRKTTSTHPSLSELIRAGFLRAPLKLIKRYKGHDLEAELLVDGTVTFRGKSFQSCSAAGSFAKSIITGHEMSTNGWQFWNYRDNNGNLLPLAVAWQEFRKQKN